MGCTQAEDGGLGMGGLSRDAPDSRLTHARIESGPQGGSGSARPLS